LLELSKRFETKLRRYYYIKPTSYLGFIKLFIDIFNEKIKIIPDKSKNINYVCKNWTNLTK